MSTTISGRAAEKTGFWLIWFIFAWPFFGWVADIDVHNESSFLEKAAAWTSVVFHIFGAASVALLVSPLWGIIWSFFAAFILVRRIGSKHVVSVTPTMIFSNADKRWVGGAVVVAALHPVINYPIFFGFVAVVAFMIFVTGAGNDVVKNTVAHRAVYEQWASRLKNIFSVPEAIFNEKAGLNLEGNLLVIDPVPDEVRVRFAALGPNGVDASLVAVDRNLELAPSSTYECIIFQPVSEETKSRREYLASSSGLFTSIGEAPDVISVPVVPSVPTQEASENLTLTLEDL